METPLKAAILTVGGSPAPLIWGLTCSRPVEVLFLVSPETEDDVTGKILPALDYTPQYEIHTFSNANHLDAIYHSVRQVIPQWLARRRISRDCAYFDFTGGTKAMAAALALAAVELIPNYRYVGGTRDKDGKGIVISGTEREVAGISPFEAANARQRDLATRLYANFQVEEAATVLRGIITGSDRSLAYSSFADLCEILAHLDLMNLNGLMRSLTRVFDGLKILLEQTGQSEHIVPLQTLIAHLQKVETELASTKAFPCPNLLLELLANAARRARQGRYDDAVQRLYRAVELFAQNHLAAAFGARSGKIDLIKLSVRNPAAAANLRKEFVAIVETETGILQLACRNAFRALAYADDPKVQSLAGTYDDLSSHLLKRNESILAHGLRPISESEFKAMWSDVVERMGVQESGLPTWPLIRF